MRLIALLVVLVVLALPCPTIAQTPQQLFTEIANDPTGRGYGVGTIPYDPLTEWKSDGEIATLLNAKIFVIDRAFVEQEAIRAATQFAWYNTLTIDEQEYIVWQTPDNGNLIVTGPMKLLLTGRGLTSNGVAGVGTDGASFWAAAVDQDAAPAMLSLIEIAGSRAEVLWGEGTFITLNQIGAAANCPCP